MVLDSPNYEEKPYKEDNINYYLGLTLLLAQGYTRKDLSKMLKTTPGTLTIWLSNGDEYLEQRLTKEQKYHIITLCERKLTKYNFGLLARESFLCKKCFQTLP